MTTLNLDDSQQGSRSEPSAEPSTSSLWRTFDQNIAQSTCHRTTATDSIIEVRRYFEEPNIERSINPLDWWRSNANRFPRLHK